MIVNIYVMSVSPLPRVFRPTLAGPRDIPLSGSEKEQTGMVSESGSEYAGCEVIDAVSDVLEGLLEGVLGAQAQRIRH
ncbi:MAG: hypothetical protein JWO49_2648 [Arthrobacter sp.]|nr:hypothetical protein [Arthrobacter sp.]